jgi:hypothetical protein
MPTKRLFHSSHWLSKRGCGDYGFERIITRYSYRFNPFHTLRQSIAYIIALQDVTIHLWRIDRKRIRISYKSFFILFQVIFTIVFFAFTKEIIANAVVNDFELTMLTFTILRQSSKDNYLHRLECYFYRSTTVRCEVILDFDIIDRWYGELEKMNEDTHIPMYNGNP